MCGPCCTNGTAPGPAFRFGGSKKKKSSNSGEKYGYNGEKHMDITECYYLTTILYRSFSHYGNPALNLPSLSDDNIILLILPS